ncbi:MAG: FecR domain-containing protein [Anaerolineae bacterium]|nr:FecR domain-containing protein [Anaerolineae bacterium]
MRRNPERLAWIVLLLSFFTCMSLVVAVPLGIRWYVLNASVRQEVALEVQRPPLSVALAGRGEPVAIAQDRDDIPERTVVDTDATSGRLVMHAPRTDDPVIIATVQLYHDTEVVLSSARSPRFPASSLPHKIVLEMRAGHVRISVPGHEERPTVVEVYTPHGAATLTEGNYEVKVNTTTEVTVRSGQANVISNEMVVRLGPAERATVGDERIVGPRPAARNLITNGDFQAPLEDGWRSYNKDIELEGEPEGQVQRTEIENQPAVVVEREGVGHAETGITQELDADIRDFSFLRLHLLLRVEEHNVPVCGSEGSECPVMVRIDYRDAYGADREWLQGFYSLLDTSTPGNQPVCVTCSTRNEHIRVSEDTWYPYLSPNLIPLLSQDGQSPILIKSVTVYASGHTYQSAIAEVELIGQE